MKCFPREGSSFFPHELFQLFVAFLHFALPRRPALAGKDSEGTKGHSCLCLCSNETKRIPNGWLAGCLFELLGSVCLQYSVSKS